MKKKIIFLLATLLIFSACTSRIPPSEKIDIVERPSASPTRPVVIDPKIEKEPSHIVTKPEPIVEQKPIEEPEPTAEPTIEKADYSETRAVWFSYLDFYDLLKGKTEAEFKNNIDLAFKNCASIGLNTVIVHARPFGDSLYESKYFPWSYVCSGTAGVNPGFDPLEIMVSCANKNNLKIEAWVNPYRVNKESIINDSWVLNGNSGVLFYDPSLEEVQTFIISGVKEIVENYDVDGIHFDDYFYTEGYKDSRYSDDECRSFVTNMVRKVHDEIKAIDKDCTFGISPQADLEKCFYKLYADVELWAKKGYIDYVAPQVYYGFYNSNIQFSGCSSAWDEIIDKTDCKMLLGLAMYKSGEVDNYAGTGKNEWVENSDTIAAQILYGRELKSYNGFIMFSYDSLFNNKNNVKQEINNIKQVLNNN